MRALLMGVVAGALAIAGLVVLRADARALFDELTSGAGLAAVLVSAARRRGTLALVRAERYEPARVSARSRSPPSSPAGGSRSARTSCRG